jgi:hypothetical protein
MPTVGSRLTSDVQAFEAHATDAELDDLRARLAAARLPEAETVHRAGPGPTLVGGNRAFRSPTSSISWTTGGPGTTGGRSKRA